MKQYKSQVQYQGSAQSQGFAPIQGLDLAPALRSNQQEAIASLSRVQEAQFLERTRYPKAAPTPPDLESLAEFSESLTRFLTGQVEAYDKAEQAAAKNWFYENEDEFNVEREQFNQGKSLINAASNFTQKVAVDSAKQGAPYSVTSKLEELSGRRKLYASILAAKSIANQYQQYITDQFKDNDTEISVGEDTFRINDPGKTLQQESAARAYLREVFMEQFGDIPTGMLSEHAFPIIRQADKQIATAYRTQTEIKESDIARQEAKQIFFEDYKTSTQSMSQLLNSFAISVDAKGNQLGYPGAWKKFEDFAKSVADTDNAIDMESVRNQLVANDPKGRTFGQLYGVRLDQIEDDIQATQNAGYSRDRTTKLQYIQAKEAEIIAGLPDDYTDADIDAAQEAFIKMAESQGIYQRSSTIDGLKQYATEDAKIRQEKVARFTYLQERGMLDPDVISRESLEIQRQFMPAAIQQQKAREATGGLKTQLKAIEGLVKTHDQVKNLPDGTTGAEPTLIIGELQDKFLRNYKEYLSETEDPVKASKLAYQDVQNEFREGVTDPTSRYYINNAGKFENLFNEQAHAKESQKYRADIAKINQVLQNVGPRGFDSPGLFGNEAFFENLEQNWGQRGWKLPPRITYWANKLGVSPFEIINRQRKALGMTELPAYTQLAQQTKQGSPEYRRFLNDLVTSNANTNSLRRFTAPIASLPLRPTFGEGEGSRLRNAIITKESGANYSAVNPDSGALGIGQVMPENVPEWTQRHLGRSMTPQEFLANPAAQERVVSGQIAQNLQDLRSAGYEGEELIRRAAAIWYAGNHKLWNDTRPQYYNGRKYPSIAEYTADIWKRYVGQ
jgi:hypothetical protein